MISFWKALDLLYKVLPSSFEIDVILDSLTCILLETKEEIQELCIIPRVGIRQVGCPLLP